MKRVFSILTVIFLFSSVACGETFIKRPNVSGRFYDSHPAQLSQKIDIYFQQADIKPWEKNIQILMAPHAGYAFSGPVAAYAYKAASRQRPKTIIILASTHFHRFQGVSIWPKGQFETPLGALPVDEEMTQQLINYDQQFRFYRKAFDQEHSLEVQLPFCQKTFSDFKIVPLIMGQPDFEISQKLAEALNAVIAQRNDVLIVISTDMSHYKPDQKARIIDRKTTEALENFKIEKLWRGCQNRTMELCGYSSVVTGLLYARLRGFGGIQVLHYGNSADASGDQSRVVGYMAAVIYEKEDRNSKPKKGQAIQMNPDKRNDRTAPLTLKQKTKLIEVARDAIETFVLSQKKIDLNNNDPRLQEEEGAFVTIHKNGRLRGCIGNIIGRRPLIQTVRDMAIAAAVDDPRFPPLKKEEWQDIDVEISVLSKPWRMQDPDEFRAGVHGAIIRRGFNQGVFLPQVATEFSWGRDEFLSHLCAHKAGLPSDAWKDPRTEVQLFTAEVFSEKDIK